MTGVGSRESGVERSRAPHPGLSTPVFAFFTAMLLAVPLFGHGCHRGDHDDEPAFVPMEFNNRGATPPAVEHTPGG